MSFYRITATLLFNVFSMLLSESAFAAVGATPGKADVSANGTARYAIRVWTPSGTGDLTPTLALKYNSSRQNGLVGVGFSLSGFSAISRCTKTIAQDGARAPIARVQSDKYCLDGSKLRLVSGTYGASGSEYRTEIDEISKITASGSAGGAGPASFTVHKKSGLVYEYGTTTSSRIEFLGSSVVRNWALSKIIDRSGNVIEFTYIEDGTNGSYRPDEIRYTTNAGQGVSTAPYVIEFIYESANRPDPVFGYVANSQVHEYKRLERIEVTHNSSIQRQYLFVYESPLGVSGRSRLESIKECAATTADCLSPTTFTWTDNSASFGVESDSGSNIPVGYRTWHLMDVDGDGRDDLVYVSITAAGGTWRIRKANTTGGFGAEINTGLANTNYKQSLSLEWDGDGKMDLAVPYSANRWYVFRSNGNGFHTPYNTGITAISAQNQNRVFDIDGDGRDDLVRISSSGAATVYVRYRGASNWGSESTLWTSGDSNITFNGGFDNYQNKYRSSVRRADINGDGKEEFLAKLREYDPESGQTTWAYHAFYNGAPGAAIDAFSADKGGNHLWTDLNGDGLTDLAWVLNAGGFRYMLSTGTGLGGYGIGPSTSGMNPAKYAVGDYNGDGREDVYIPHTSNGLLYHLKSTGSGLANAVSTGISGMANLSVLLVGDLNGSGHTDLLLQKSTADALFRLHAATPADLLASATNGLGVAATFTYAPMTKPGLHTPLTGSVWPISEYQIGTHIVEKLAVSDGIGGTGDLSYTYEGARRHLTGRGFLGFNKRIVTDSRTGNKRTYSYEQDGVNSWERIGQVLSELGETSASKKIFERTLTWSNKQSGTGNEIRRFPYINSETAKRYEINSVGGNSNPLLLTRTRTTTMDSYGTATTIAVTTAENNTGNHALSSKTMTINQVTLVNDTANWCLGRPTQTNISASHTLTDGTAITRRIDHTWSAAQCRPTQKVIEPTSASWKVTTGLGYDSFGNINSITITPVGQSSRVTTLNWGTDGRFLKTITNPLSQSTTQTWHEAFGEVDALTDANGLVTSWAYDGFARLTRQVRPDGTASTYEYLACDSDCTGVSNAKLKLRLREVKDSSGTVFSEQFLILDKYWRALRDSQYELGGAKIDVLSKYNNQGQLYQRSQPHFNGTGTPVWTTLSYDTLGRMTSAVRDDTNDVDLSSSTTSISYQGLKSVTTDPLSKTATEILHAWGTVDEVLDADGQDVDYEYDAFANLTKTTDTAGHVIDIDYNVVGFKTSSSDPDLGNWTYDYYPFGELKSQTNAKSQTTTFTYDKLSRPLTRVEPEGTTTWTWDASSASCSAGGTGGKGIGRLATAASPGGYQEKYCYDDKGRPKFVRTVADSGNYDFGYTYHSDWGVLDTMTYPSSTGTPFKVSYEYETANKSGLMKAVKDFYSPYTVFWQATSTDAFRQYQDITLGNGLKTYRSLDSVTGAMRGIDTGPGGGIARQQLDYVWNKVGYLTQRSDANQSVSETFAYDNLHRMYESRRNGVVNLGLSYSIDGNIDSKSDVGTYNYTTAQTGCSYYSHAQPHAVRKAGSKIYCYDQNGNMTKRDGATIGWSSYNLPTAINQTGGNSSTFSYGADRQRYKRVNVNGAVTETTIYVQNSLFEKITSGTDTEYKHQIIGGDGAAAIHTRRNPGSSDTVYLLTDHLGSVDKITNSSGSILVNLSYDAFGKRRGANWSGNPSSGDWTVINDNTHRGYTGHEHLDNLSLIHMNGRVYDPDIGRFLSADPFIPGLFNGQSFNRYSYVRNNPLSFTDPSGFEDVITWCWRCDDIQGLLDDIQADFEASLHDESSWQERQDDPTFNGTIYPHPERNPQDDWQTDDCTAGSAICDGRREEIKGFRGDIALEDSLRCMGDCHDNSDFDPVLMNKEQSDAFTNGTLSTIGAGLAGTSCVKTRVGCDVAGVLAADALRQFSTAVTGTDPIVSAVKGAGGTDLQAAQIAQATDYATAVYTLNRTGQSLLQRAGTPAAGGVIAAGGKIGETALDAVSSANTINQLGE